MQSGVLLYARRSQDTTSKQLTQHIVSLIVKKPSQHELVTLPDRRSLRGSSRRSTAADEEDPEVNGGVNDLYDDLVQSSHVRMLEERHAELQKRLKEFESGPAM